MRKLVQCLALALLVLATPLSASALDVPSLKGRVNDYADMISPGTERDLDESLAELQRTDGTQVVVLTVPSLQGDSLEDFSMRVLEAWKIGQKGKDNGVLLLVSRDERTVRIEVGYGLEGRLTDVLAGHLIDQIMTPYFRLEQYDKGFEEGVEGIVAGVHGEYSLDQSSIPGVNQWTILAAVLFLGVGLVYFCRRSYTNKYGWNPEKDQANAAAAGFEDWAHEGRRHHRGGGFSRFSGGGGGFGGGGASGSW
ncbi:TPM domain-containing protein [Salidesulfovibrio onnuriiensis]|uniref:TPM domain-containing protein n=1 Tax=Salidesulfovibrio onnuriiensis TaxID=2583823 RepID=UPI0011C750F4|nr:TPM domain-containing protein [Salidesulfovibrio onnuriiensis]